MSDPHVIARGGQRAPCAPGEPFGAGGEAVGPAFAPVEVGDEGEHLEGGDVDAGGEIGDAFAEFEEVVVHWSGLLKCECGKGFSRGQQVPPATIYAT